MASHLGVQPLLALRRACASCLLDPGQLLARLAVLGAPARPWARPAAGGAGPRSRPSAPLPAGCGPRPPDRLRRGAQVEVLVDAAGQVADCAVAEQRDLAVDDPLEQVAVVRDDEEGAGPAVEEVLERGEGLDVEVVGRLVEEQHVGLGHQQPQQLEAPPLAAGQVADPGLLAAAGEPEPLPAELALTSLSPSRVHSADVLDRLDHPPVGHLVRARGPPG